ncbi:MAG: hypothetical protein V7L05_08485, partial [Nostoc sp.]|uniref:hypothetical protein n=1 Tax=Nostoc sp. TaxID=1180 RepID=UPI002FF4EC0B
LTLCEKTSSWHGSRSNTYPISILCKLKVQQLSNGNLVWTVPENHCFVRGDGLVSMDSLIVGPIPLSALTGIAVMKLPRRLDVDSVHQLREASDVKEI